MRFMASCVCCVARRPSPSQRKRRRFRLECVQPKGRRTAAEYQQNRPTFLPRPETTAVFIRVAAREDGSPVTLEPLCPRSRSDTTLQSGGGGGGFSVAPLTPLRRELEPPHCVSDTQNITPKQPATPKWSAAHRDFFTRRGKSSVIR